MAECRYTHLNGGEHAVIVVFVEHPAPSTGFYGRYQLLGAMAHHGDTIDDGRYLKKGEGMIQHRSWPHVQQRLEPLHP
jgi:hypothetical protein